MAERYLKELKITETQVAITKHTDKAHLHLHIMANMVNNKGKAISSSWIGSKRIPGVEGTTIAKTIQVTKNKFGNEIPSAIAGK